MFQFILNFYLIVCVLLKINISIYVFFSQYGFSNNLETYGLISGLWTSTFALGAFIGPSIAGVLYDIVGFGAATLFVIVLSAIVVSNNKTSHN